MLGTLTLRVVPVAPLHDVVILRICALRLVWYLCMCGIFTLRVVPVAPLHDVCVVVVTPLRRLAPFFVGWDRSAMYDWVGEKLARAKTAEGV